MEELISVSSTSLLHHWVPLAASTLCCCEHSAQFSGLAITSPLPFISHEGPENDCNNCNIPSIKSTTVTKPTITLFCSGLSLFLVVPFLVTVNPRSLNIRQGETAKFMCQIGAGYTGSMTWSRRPAVSSALCRILFCSFYAILIFFLII